ncbi:MAG: LysM peptidoglycan-binding domain-containing protein [Treponema sp.]|jgi:LysM repeat protein|nr:LysM peptidoglycan-binding domain-containing protein [Treponema sp.]
MNSRCGIFSFLLFITICSFAEDTVHVVEKGQTVYSISRAYQISPEELMRYNDISDASKLQIGRRLKIPRPVPENPISPSSVSGAGTLAAGGGTSGAYTEYRAVKNDTLYSIARRHGIGLQELLKLNGFSQNHVLKEGEGIKIPQGTAATSTVSAGAASSGGNTPTRTGQSGAEVRQTSVKTVDAALRWPVRPKESAYMTGKLYGVVLVGERSESVKSLTQGTVVSAGPYRGFGRVAIVQVTGGYLYVYGGCESLSVKEGDRIGPGTELGKLGIDAVSEKPQLFFLVYRNNNPIDPAKAPRA